MYKIFVVTGLRDGWKSSRSIEYYDQVYKDVNLKVDRVISGSLPESAGSKLSSNSSGFDGDGRKGNL